MRFKQPKYIKDQGKIVFLLRDAVVAEDWGMVKLATSILTRRMEKDILKLRRKTEGRMRFE